MTTGGLGTGSHHPGSLFPACPGARFPSSPMRCMLHAMATVTVRVVPRSSGVKVEEGADGALVIRVTAAPEGGKATEQAARALADHLGVKRSQVRLKVGQRSRTKVFEVP